MALLKSVVTFALTILLLSGCSGSVRTSQTLTAENNAPVRTVDPALTRMAPREDISTLLNRAISYCQKAKLHHIEGDHKAALHALDNAYSALLLIPEENTPQMSQQKENLRYLISKRILEIHAIRNKAEIGTHTPIPLIMNRQVKAEIKMLTKGGEKSFFSEAYRRSGRYRYLIVRELRAADLPEELSWLPLIESGFREDALSQARALGLWQFIPSTGYRFGLKRNNYVDERLDPVKSTRAAVAYLNELHDLFGDWSTALAAYNCGEKTVLKLIQEQHISYLDNFWDLYGRLPRETQRYVARFIATLHIVKAPGKYGINALAIDRPVSYETVSISRHISLRDIALKIGTSEDLMKFLNPELKYGILPGASYHLRIPLNKKYILAARLDSIPRSPSPSGSFIYHKVKKGDTLSSIARKYKASLDKIVRINNIGSNHHIVVGKVLKIPRESTLTCAPAEQKATDET